MMNEINDNQPSEQLEEFETVTKPLRKWLADNHHPHTKVIVDSVGAELFEGVLSVSSLEFIKD